MLSRTSDIIGSSTNNSITKPIIVDTIAYPVTSSKKDNFELLRYQLLGEASILFLISHSLSHVLSLTFSLFLSVPPSPSLSRSLTLPSPCRRDSRPIIRQSTQPYMS
ncbi:hypothetical protein RIF29_20524 [Crotalaria pallida]|uniref:Uncharacterized protein n=1 Tax=Crotalaria pallida TaxID=3830 RepID=A0AAN9F3M2_CROPI